MFIRPARPEDAPAIAELQIEAWQKRMSQWAPADVLAQLNVPEQTAKYAERATHPDYTMAVANLNGQIAGFAACRTNAAEPLAYTRELSALYTHGAFIRQGVGKALMNYILTDRKSSSGLVVWTFRDNAPARALYQSCGGKLLPNTAYPGGDHGVPHVCYGWAPAVSR